MNDTKFQFTPGKHTIPHSGFYSGAPVCLYPQAAHNALRAQEELMTAARSMAEAKQILESCDDDTYFQVISSLEYLQEHVASAGRAIDGVASYNMSEQTPVTRNNAQA